MLTLFFKWYFIMCLLICSYSITAQNDSTKACQEACCFKDRTPSGVVIAHLHSKKGLMLSYRYMGMNMGNMISGNSRIGDDKVFKNYLMSSKYMHMDMHMFMIMYGLSSRLTVMGMVDYSFNTMTMLMPPGSTHIHGGVENVGDRSMDMKMNTAGFNDAKLYALFGIVNGLHHQLILNAGVSIPTGTIKAKGNATSMYPQHRVPYLMQLGSGTLDMLPGLTWIYHSSNFSLSSQITSVVRTGVNKVGYRLGNEATSNTWVAYQWIKFLSSSLRAECSTANGIKGNDKSLYSEYEPSASAANYGNKKVVAYLGTKFYIKSILAGTLTVAAEYGIPLYQNVYGIQMETSSFLHLSANLMF